jgi:hypothetical protein
MVLISLLLCTEAMEDGGLCLACFVSSSLDSGICCNVCIDPTPTPTSTHTPSNQTTTHESSTTHSELTTGLNCICLPRMRLAAYVLGLFGAFVCCILGYTISVQSVDDGWVAYWVAIILVILVVLCCLIEGLHHCYLRQSTLSFHVAHLSSHS